MKLRIFTGVVAAALLVALTYYGSLSLITTVVLVCATFAYVEFDRLFFVTRSMTRQMRLAVLIALTVIAIQQDQTAGWYAFWFCFVFLCAVHVFDSNKGGDFGKSVESLSLETLGYIYTVSLFGFIVPIAALPGGRDFLLLLFFIVFVGDTAAYFVGSKMGKHPLASRLSPKKTAEGSLASIVSSAASACLWIFFIYRGPVDQGFVTKVFIFAILGNALAQLGDLCESLLKRSRSQKDSGYFLPGHGGILDRIDGLALVSPVYYMFLTSVLAI